MDYQGWRQWKNVVGVKENNVYFFLRFTNLWNLSPINHISQGKHIGLDSGLEFKTKLSSVIRV